MLDGFVSIHSLAVKHSSLEKRTANQSRKHSPEVWPNLLSRVYGGHKTVLPSKALENSEDEDKYDYSNVVVDETGLPRTYSDTLPISNALIEKQRLNQQEQDRALDSLLKASRAVSKLWFQQKQYRYSDSSRDSESTDGIEHSSIDCIGPGTLEELEMLRSAIDSLSDAYDQADLSGRARTLRCQGVKEKQAKSDFTIPSLKRKSVPGFNCPVDIIAPEDINPFLISPELQEELSFATSPVMIRSTNMRGIFTNRALRKPEVKDDSSDDSSDNEDGSIARYYTSKHRASRKNEFQGLARTGMETLKGNKLSRRRTSVLESRHDLKSHLLIQSEGLERYHQGINTNFLETLDDEHRRALGPAYAPLYDHAEVNSSSSSSDERQSNSISDYSRTSSDAVSSQGSHSPPSEVSNFRSCPTFDDADDGFARDESWLGSLSNSSTSLLRPLSSSEAETDYLGGLFNKTAGKTLIALSPPRPKRHPLRPDSLVTTRLPQLNGSELYYSTNMSSSDLTPRPDDLMFQR